MACQPACDDENFAMPDWTGAEARLLRAIKDLFVERERSLFRKLVLGCPEPTEPRGQETRPAQEPSGRSVEVGSCSLLWPRARKKRIWHEQRVPLSNHGSHVCELPAWLLPPPQTCAVAIRNIPIGERGCYGMQSREKKPSFQLGPRVVASNGAAIDCLPLHILD